MNIHEIVKTAQKLAADNAPAILTAIGVTGSLTTAYLTGKASFRAAEILQEVEAQHQLDNVQYKDLGPMTVKTKAQLVWKLYVPAAATAAMTVTAIVGANRIGTRRAAAMAAAWSLSEKGFSEYKDKVVEKLGVNKDQAVRDEIAQDRVKANPVSQNQVVFTGNGDVLCMDAYSGRYFQSSMEAMKKAQNDTNYEIINNRYASLSDLYNRLGLDNTKMSDDMGWNSDKLLEMTFTTTMTDEDRPCIVMDFAVAPVRSFFRTH